MLTRYAPAGASDVPGAHSILPSAKYASLFSKKRRLAGGRIANCEAVCEILLQ